MPEKASRNMAAMRRRWKLAAAALVVGAVAALAIFGAAGSPSKAAARKGGIARSASSAIRSGARSSSTQAQSTNPIVGTGHFDGSSPLVSSLPVLPVSPATQIRSRDNENLHPNTQPSTAKDPVVQKQKGSGPISAPISNFDGICLPFGPPVLAGEHLLVPAAGHERRGRRDPVRPDGEQRLRRLLEDRQGASAGDADRPALEGHEQRVRDPQRRRPGGGVRPAREAMAADAVHREPGRPASPTASASRSRRRATRPARTTCTRSCSRRTSSSTTRSSACGRTATTCPRTSSRTAPRPRAARPRSCSSAAR